MNKQELKKLILSGKIFICPTNTIYGTGCNALNKRAVEKIREIKKRGNLKRYLPAPVLSF